MTNSVVFALTLLSAGFYGSSYVRFYMRERAAGCSDADSGVRRLNGMFLLVYLAVAVLCLVGCGAMVLNVHALFSGGLTAQEINLARALLMIMGVNIAVTMLSTPFDSYIVAHERFVFQQSRQLFTALAQPFLAVLLLWLGMGRSVWHAPSWTISTILLVWNIAFAMRKLNMRFTFHGLEMVSIQSCGDFQFLIFLNQIFRFGHQSAASSSSAIRIFFGRHRSPPPARCWTIGIRSNARPKAEEHDRVDAERLPGASLADAGVQARGEGRQNRLRLSRRRVRRRRAARGAGRA